MEDNTLPKKFIFSEEIDETYLFSLYTDDYPYIEEIFATTVLHFDQDLESVKLAFDGENPEELRKAVHKIKPTFGFTGLLAIQSLCKQFEDLCMQCGSTREISAQFKKIFNILSSAGDLIAAEYKRLKAFNANPI